MFLISIYAVNILKSSTYAMHPSLSSNNKKEKGALYASYRVLYSYIHTVSMICKAQNMKGKGK